MTNFIKVDYSLGVIFLISLLLILAALAFQHIGGLLPCDLCYKQRWVYYLAIAGAPMALFFYGRGLYQYTLIILFILGISFLANLGLGIYHAGIEWEWWAGPTGCSDLGQLDATIDLMDALKKTKVVACDEVQWTFLGLSMAGYSALASLALSMIAFFTAKACMK